MNLLKGYQSVPRKRLVRREFDQRVPGPGSYEVRREFDKEVKGNALISKVLIKDNDRMKGLSMN